MSRGRAVAIVLCLLGAAAVVGAQTDRVRVIEDGGSYAVVGTDRFSLRVDRSGAIGQVMVGETEYCWLIRLYTTLTDSTTGEPVRAVQGEGDRGIGPLPDAITPELRGQTCSIILPLVGARDQVLGGEPIYRLTQTVTVHPSGYINLRYEFDWLHMVRLGGANLVIALRAAPLAGRQWWADFTTNLLRGRVSDLPDTNSLADIKGDLRVFTVDCGEADLGLWINDSGRVTAQRWNPQDYAFFLDVPGLGYPRQAFPDTRAVIDVDFVLPVPRED